MALHFGHQAVTVTSALGEERQARVYLNGSWACPFCAAACSDVCRNPACDAGIFTTRERALERLATRERRAAEAAERGRVAAIQRRYF